MELELSKEQRLAVLRRARDFLAEDESHWVTGRYATSSHDPSGITDWYDVDHIGATCALGAYLHATRLEGIITDDMIREWYKKIVDEEDFEVEFDQITEFIDTAELADQVLMGNPDIDLMAACVSKNHPDLIGNSTAKIIIFNDSQAIAVSEVVAVFDCAIEEVARESNLGTNTQ